MLMKIVESPSGLWSALPRDSVSHPTFLRRAPSTPASETHRQPSVSYIIMPQKAKISVRTSGAQVGNRYMKHANESDLSDEGAHTDFDVLTMLFQRAGEGGLEVCPGRAAVGDFAVGSTWTPVPARGDIIVCNIGDQLMRWSDDVFKSNFHRVKMPSKDMSQGPRYSIAFFNQARSKTVIQGPLQKYPPIVGRLCWGCRTSLIPSRPANSSLRKQWRATSLPSKPSRGRCRVYIWTSSAQIHHVSPSEQSVK